MEEPKRQSLRFVATVETSLIKHSSRVNLSVASCNNWALVERHVCWKYAWVNNLWVLFLVTMVIPWGSIKQQNGKGGCHIQNRCGRPKYVCLGCHFLGHTQCPSSFSCSRGHTRRHYSAFSVFLCSPCNGPIRVNVLSSERLCPCGVLLSFKFKTMLCSRYSRITLVTSVPGFRAVSYCCRPTYAPFLQWL